MPKNKEFKRQAEATRRKSRKAGITVTGVIKACSSWPTRFMDKGCQDCQLRELCCLIDYYNNDVKEELTNRGKF